MRPRALADLALPVEAPATSTLAQLAERSGCSVLDARRTVRAMARGIDSTDSLTRSALRLVMYVYELGDREREDLYSAVAP